MWCAELGRFREDLPDLIEDLKGAGSEFLILETGANYVQALFTPVDVYAEVPPVGNDTARVHFSLVRLGWSVPGSVCRPWCANPHSAFQRVWADVAKPAVIATGLLQALAVACLRHEGEPIRVTRDRRAAGAVH
jgi:hypothetical protein